MPTYPKYHPPIDWPYAVQPQGRVYRVLPSPAQRIGKKEARLWEQLFKVSLMLMKIHILHLFKTHNILLIQV